MHLVGFIIRILLILVFQFWKERRKLRNEDPYDLYTTNVIRVIKSRELNGLEM
jgi:hypothetical protein